MPVRFLVFGLVVLWAGASSASEGNIARVSITGSFNGGSAGLDVANSIAALNLSPGSIVQQGSENTVDLSVSGDRNMFALSQTGSGNVISGVIIGERNQVGALQTGNRNTISFTVIGVGNSLAVRQHSP